MQTKASHPRWLRTAWSLIQSPCRAFLSRRPLARMLLRRECLAYGLVRRIIVPNLVRAHEQTKDRAVCPNDPKSHRARRGTLAKRESASAPGLPLSWGCGEGKGSQAEKTTCLYGVCLVVIVDQHARSKTLAMSSWTGCGGSCLCPMASRRTTRLARCSPAWIQLSFKPAF